MVVQLTSDPGAFCSCARESMRGELFDGLFDQAQKAPRSLLRRSLVRWSCAVRS